MSRIDSPRVLFRGITEIWIDNFEGSSKEEIESIVAHELAAGKYRGDDGKLFSDHMSDTPIYWEYTVLDPETGTPMEWNTVHEPDSEEWEDM